jgi:hypothetical protein
VGAEDRDQAVPLTSEPLGKIVDRCAASPDAIEEPLHSATQQLERAVPLHQHESCDRHQDERPTAEVRAALEAGVDAQPCDDRREAEDR